MQPKGRRLQSFVSSTAAATFAGVLAAITTLASGCAPSMRIQQRPGLQPLESAVLLRSSTIPLAWEEGLDSPPARTEEAVSVGPSDTVWTIENGIYSGKQIPLRPRTALGGGRKTEHFWRLPARQHDSPGVVGWRSNRYPVPVAFHHGRSSGPISAGDSAGFWQVLAQMNADFGRELFRPVALKADADPDDVIVVDVKPLASNVEGLSRVTWSEAGELFDVRVSFRAPELLRDAQVVTHEMMHALGFGHTSSWRSVVNSGDVGLPQRVTPSDVAYAEAAMHSRETGERADMHSLMALAIDRELPRPGGTAGYAPCPPESSNPAGAEEPMRTLTLLPIGLLTVVSACSAGDTNRKGPDTVAVPAATAKR